MARQQRVNTGTTGQSVGWGPDTGLTSVVHNCSTKLVISYPVPFCDRPDSRA